MIHILRPPDHDGHRFEDDVDESMLVCLRGVEENADTRVTWVEYRLPGDDCIVHRSATIDVKRWPGEAGATTGVLPIGLGSATGVLNGQ